MWRSPQRYKKTILNGLRTEKLIYRMSARAEKRLYCEDEDRKMILSYVGEGRKVPLLCGLMTEKRLCRTDLRIEKPLYRVR